jgi:hypothetical protein
MMGENPPKLTCCNERVTRSKPPHASKELGKSTVEERHANNEIWNGYVARMHIVKGEDERRRGKSEHSSTVFLRKVDEFQR